MIGEIEHVVLCRSKDRYCGHPRQGGIHYFGGGELVVIHNHAPCSYRAENDVWHGRAGYHGRACCLLQRSMDDGVTWPEENNVVIFDETSPLEERRARLFAENPQRDQIDMSRPESIFIFRESYCGERLPEGMRDIVLFCLRSPDKGRTWERTGTIIEPPPGRENPILMGHPPVRMPDGSFLAAITIDNPTAVTVYGSDDDGLSWEYLAEVVRDTTGQGRTTYGTLIQLPDGEIQCYWLGIDSMHNAMCMSYSHDGGYSWSGGKPIVRWGHSPWGHASGPKPDSHVPMKHYRSPWPVLMRDGRIVVLFGRRRPPSGIGCLVSEDNGRTWGPECVIRSDGSSPDLGYPVAVELDDGRLFTAYYITQEDGNKFGGTRFIAGSFFKVI